MKKQLESQMQIAEKYLEENGPSDFSDIFQHIKKIFWEIWKKNNPQYPEQYLEEKKAGELHKLLTVSEKFIYLISTRKWNLTENLYKQ